MYNSEREIEAAVLGSLMMYNGEQVGNVLAFLKPKYLSCKEHQIIYRAIEVLHQSGTEVNILSVTRILREKNQLDRAGGPVYISQLTNRFTGPYKVEAEARIVFQNHMVREISRMSSGIMQRATDPSVDPFDLLSEAEKSLAELKDGIYAGRDNMMSVKEILPGINSDIEKRLAGELVGLTTGFSELDEVLHGWMKSDLIYVGGRPGSGKTSALLTIAIILGELSIPTAFFSLEMSAKQLVGRLISQIIAVPYGDIMQTKVDSYVLDRFHSMMGKIERLPIYIDDTPALTISEIRRRTRKAVDKYGVEMMFVDYVQLAHGSDTKSKNREQEVSEVSRGLKQCAKENAIPVMAAAQLGRPQNEKDKPTLKHLRESGSLEQDADVVIFPYRAEYYGILEDEKGNSTAGKAEMIIAKHRNGGLGNPVLNFVARLAKFESSKPMVNKSAPHPDSFIDPKVKANTSFLDEKDTPF